MSEQKFDSVIELTVLGQEFLNEGRLKASQVIADAIEHIEKLESQLQASEWVSVEDGLPEPSEMVLVWFGKPEHADCDIKFETDYVDICPVSGNQFFINNGEDVTHWKPITPPKEVE